MGKIKEIKYCAVCGKQSNYKFYNVQSCEGCKQFFRRIIAKQVAFFCLAGQGQSCGYPRNRCRGCRLDHCLILGMDPNCVQTERTEKFRQFVNKIEIRRQKLLEKIAESDARFFVICSNKSSDENLLPNIVHQNGPFGPKIDWESFSHCCNLIFAQKIVWDRFHDVPDEYLGRFQTIGQVLEGPDNLLFYSPFLSVTAKYHSNSLHMKSQGLGVVLLMVAGILKGMSAFRKLAFADKLIVARELCLPIHNFTKIYYSLKNGSKIITGRNGRALQPILSAKYKNEPRIMKLSAKAFIRPMDAFYRVPLLKQEEYALLMAILCSTSSISGLSDEARNLLAEQQCRLSQLLMQYLQIHLGGMEGARRFAECIQLLENAFNAANNFELLQTYIGAFYPENDDPVKEIYPQCLKAIAK